MRNISLTVSAIIISLLSLASNAGNAQFNNNYWLFGDSAGINWTNPANPILLTSMLKGRGTSVSLSDTNGVIIYSGTGQKINFMDRTKTFNKFNEKVPNSDSINGEGWYHEMLLIPHPGNDSLVYLVSIGVNGYKGLFYTLINYKANNDSGMVIQKNIALQQVPAFDGLTAVQHGNGRDWWVLFKTFDQTFPYVNNNLFYLYLVKDVGITFIQSFSVGSLHNDGGGQLIFSNNGNQLCLITWGGLIEIYSFDRCTGQITNPTNIEQFRTIAPYPYYISASFSPDDSKLYVMSVSPANLPGENDTLFQYDLYAPNIQASKQIIYVYPTYESGMGNMKLAPDNKIYITAADEIASIPYPDSLFTTINNNLSVINYPDSLGAACNFQPFSFNLGAGKTYFGLPNNPDYELGAWVGSPCDTLSVGLPQPAAIDTPLFQAWYNSEWNMIHVNASKLKGRTGSLRLFDMEGRLVYEKKVEVIAGGYVTGEIPMNAVAKGVYLVNLITDFESVSTKLVKY